MDRLSKLAESLTGSEIVRLGNEINDRIRKGEKIYNFTIGDFDPAIFPIPFELEELIIESYQKHYTNYPPGAGLLELRKAVSAFIKEWEGLEYSPAEIQVACGGRPLIYTLFKSIVDKDDKVVYAVPSWNNNHYVHMNEGRHCVIEAMPENNFLPTAQQVALHIAEAVLICLCTPQNPTGTTFSKDELEKICDLIIEENRNRGEDEKKLYLMFDQMYWNLTYGDTQHFNPVSLRPDMKNYTVFIDGISKAFASTGVRVGWAFGPEQIISKMRALLSHIGAWAPMAEQKATALYLTQNDKISQHLTKFRLALNERLILVYEKFMQLKAKGYKVDAIAPQAAIYLTVKFDLAGKNFKEKTLTQADVTEYILCEAKLALVPFYAFGAGSQSPWYRLSVGACRVEEIDDVFKGLENALEKLGE